MLGYVSHLWHTAITQFDRIDRIGIKYFVISVILRVYISYSTGKKL